MAFASSRESTPTDTNTCITNNYYRIYVLRFVTMFSNTVKMKQSRQCSKTFLSAISIQDGLLDLQNIFIPIVVWKEMLVVGRNRERWLKCFLQHTRPCSHQLDIIGPDPWASVSSP